MIKKFTDFTLHFWIDVEKFKGASRISALFLNFFLFIFKLIFCVLLLLILTPIATVISLREKSHLSTVQKLFYIISFILCLVVDIILLFISIAGILTLVRLIIDMQIITALFCGALTILSSCLTVYLYRTLFGEEYKRKDETNKENKDINNVSNINLDSFKKSETDNMSGIDFEYYCAKLLQLNGYTDVSVTSGSGDHGIDIIATKDDAKWGFQCKFYTSSVGNVAVREAFAGKAFYHCDVAVVITNSDFTYKAKEYAKETGILLWDKNKLNELVEISKPDDYTMLSESVKSAPIQCNHVITIDQKIVTVVNEIVEKFGAGSHVISKDELCFLLEKEYKIPRESIIPSDYCYNRINDGIDYVKKPTVFEYLEKNKYRCLGEDYPYNGNIYHKEQIVGICKDGKRILF